MKELGPINNSYINKTMSYHKQILSNSPLQENTKNESCRIKQSKEEARQNFFSNMCNVRLTQTTSPITTKFSQNTFSQPQTSSSKKLATSLNDNVQAKPVPLRAKFSIASTLDRISQLQKQLNPSIENYSFGSSTTKIVGTALTNQSPLQSTYIRTPFITSLSSSQPTNLATASRAVSYTSSKSIAAKNSNIQERINQLKSKCNNITSKLDNQSYALEAIKTEAAYKKNNMTIDFSLIETQHFGTGWEYSQSLLTKEDEENILKNFTLPKPLPHHAGSKIPLKTTKEKQPQVFDQVDSASKNPHGKGKVIINGTMKRDSQKEDSINEILPSNNTLSKSDTARKGDKVTVEPANRNKFSLSMEQQRSVERLSQPKKRFDVK